MNQPRETIYAAVFARASAAKIGSVNVFETTHRRFKLWTDVPTVDKPCLIQTQMKESGSETDSFGQELWKLRVMLLIYTEVAIDDTVIPSQVMNPILDAVEAAFKPTIGDKQTLGGSVVHCWIDGEIVIMEPQPPTDVHMVAAIPISILTGE